jgi:hypothetical protein
LKERAPFALDASAGMVHAVGINSTRAKFKTGTPVLETKGDKNRTLP